MSNEDELEQITLWRRAILLGNGIDLLTSLGLPLAKGGDFKIDFLESRMLLDGLDCGIRLKISAKAEIFMGL
jgi:hypothetical protein